MGLIFVPLWSGKDKKWKEIAWIGPIDNLKNVPRRTVCMNDKITVMKRQHNICNFCTNKISLGEYNSDLDLESFEKGLSF